jgi:hypothetical protein
MGTAASLPVLLDRGVDEAGGRGNLTTSTPRSPG